MIDPILEEIYSTVLPSATYIIAAYVLMWVALLVYVVVLAHGVKRAEKRMSLLEEQVEELKQSDTHDKKPE